MATKLKKKVSKSVLFSLMARPLHPPPLLIGPAISGGFFLRLPLAIIGKMIELINILFFLVVFVTQE